jgi:DnaJ-class molecular chaperone
VVCRHCKGTGTREHAGYSLSPFSSTWVRDPQETVSEDCPRCLGSGEVEDPVRMAA